MKKTFALFLICYGIVLSSYFGYWTLRDNAALEDAVRLERPQIELRHRINVGFEGTWFLLSNLLVVAGVLIYKR